MSSRSITVGILMGSSSDLDAMRAAGQALADLEIPHELRIMSAHRTPDVVDEYVTWRPIAGYRY